jgi:hypothetical protein
MKTTSNVEDTGQLNFGALRSALSLFVGQIFKSNGKLRRLRSPNSAVVQKILNLVVTNDWAS